MNRPMTEAEEKRYTAGIPRGEISLERIWNKRPDGFTIKMPTTEKAGEFVILELYFKVPQAGIESIRSKLAHDHMDTAPNGPIPPLITSLQAWQPNNIRRQKEKEKKGVG